MAVTVEVGDGREIAGRPDSGSARLDRADRVRFDARLDQRTSMTNARRAVRAADDPQPCESIHHDSV